MTTSVEQNVNTYSRPSDLKITDLRIANLAGLPMRCTIIRIDTNQGISGYGEVRDGASKTYALLLKSRLLGENPCNIDKIFRKIKQFGHHARQAGGVCGVEMALMDLAGKAYGVPAYQLAGGKFRDKILCYSDTPSVPDGKEMGRRLKARMEQGFKFLKMDVGIGLLRDVPGALIAPPGMLETRTVMHQFTGIQITDKGIDHLCQYVADVRSEIGYEIPLAVDHFGHIGLKSCIRLGKALDQFTLAWYEDMIPWQFPEQWAQLTQAVDTPTCTGEDIYLKEGFKPLLEHHAVDIIHPDLASSGGILETKKIGDMAQDYGIAMAMHMAGSPISCLANVHCAAATENFLVLENHSVDIPEWNELVTGLPNPLIQDGYIQVPEKPGLGFDDINEELFRKYLDPRDPIYFDQPTDAWDNEWSWDRLWS
ncbi:mandelate racemase/muconate lactonizing enzyme family protein [Litorilinea aerophila]|uniref:Mandelate racemase/muconate lactonizing enzyme family protein n=1 Tax=Litorilinea aerophila TaxID=1204385 RepID=A0A540VBW2_9CHLR|nr:mandelate racemase/muconate lactonizing enzyme family protein [Litorilinea aerophila]MCC9077992.1 mandelate racemase/muconate lactonizing enzyme family protein [Litorilinea aerophila]OUC08607.1 mandelate racemase [Litorilinea aerophila]